MATQKTINLSNTLVKARFREDFTSDALNSKFTGLLKKGIYHGFIPAAPVAGDLPILIGANGYSSAIVETVAPVGFSLTVKSLTNFTIDASGVGAGTFSLRLKAAFDVTAPTTGLTTVSFLITDIGDAAGPDIIKICNITVDGTGAITAFDTTVPTNRDDNTLGIGTTGTLLTQREGGAGWTRESGISTIRLTTATDKAGIGTGVGIDPISRLRVLGISGGSALDVREHTNTTSILFVRNDERIGLGDVLSADLDASTVAIKAKSGVSRAFFIKASTGNTLVSIDNLNEIFNIGTTVLPVSLVDRLHVFRSGNCAVFVDAQAAGAKLEASSSLCSVGSSTGTDFVIKTSGDNRMRFNLGGTEITPEQDNTIKLGNATGPKRWSEIHAVNIFTGDQIFANGMRFTEDGDSLVLKSKDGKNLLKINSDQTIETYGDIIKKV